MLNYVIKFSLQHRLPIVVLSLVALLYGTYATTTLPIDVFPDLDRPRVTVMTECTGLAPEEVETLVTYPLESALLGANGVRDVRSQSGFGLSVVYVEFDWSTDIRTARQIVQERLATVSADMPDGVRPQMAPVSSILGQIVVTGLRRQPGPKGGELVPIPGTTLYAERIPRPAAATPELLAWQVVDRRNPATWQSVAVADVKWDALDADGDQRVRAAIGGLVRDVTFPSELKRQLALRTMADWVVRPRLLKESGVAQVVVMGGGRKQYQVLVDPTALQEYGVSLQEVEEALKANNVNFSGGYSTLGGVEKPVRVIGRLGPRSEMVVADLRQIPVKSTAHRTIVLDQVAKVVEGPQIKRGDSSINGYPAVALTITKQPHVDTRALTDRIKIALKDSEISLPADVVVETELYQLRDFIDRGIFNVGEALVIGAVLVLIILFLFLLNLRTTFISLTAIPVSLAITTITFKLVGVFTGVELSMNVMTLGGIAVAMGELVDDAIVDVENIFRRLRENNLLPRPRSALRVIYEASVEVRSAIVFGTVMVILVFIPLFALSGIEGRLFTPLAVAYIVSILASLAVSMTLTPVMSYYLLARAKAAHRERDGLLLRVLKRLAAPLIRFSMKHITPLLAITWLLVGLCGWWLATAGLKRLPPFDEGTVQMNVTLPAGSSLEASNESAALVDARLRTFQKSPSNPDGLVLSFARRTGRAELDEHVEPPNASEYLVTINPESGKSRSETLDTLQAAIKEEVPGVGLEVEQPLNHLISHMISGSTTDIAVKIYGDDLDTLRRIADQIKAALADVQGLRSVEVDPIRMVDEIHIKLRPADLAFYGVSRAYVGRLVETALNGEVVSQVVEDQRRFDLLIRLAEPYRADVANLGRLRIDLPDGRGQVMLSDLADITPLTGGDAGANQVKRENVRRWIVVKCNVKDRDDASVAADIKTVVDGLRAEWPEGCSVDYAGGFKTAREASRLIGVLSIVALVGMFFVLYIPFPSVRVVAQILNAVPAAFIGGVVALMISGQTLTVASLVGFISLGGIAARNGILLISHYLHLMRHEREGFTENMILRGSLERLSPVLMTALTAGIALVPLVLVGHEPGREILYPVATVILGGLITSTFCEFLLRPGLFWRFSGNDVDRLLNRDRGEEDLDGPPAKHEPRSPTEAG